MGGRMWKWDTYDLRKHVAWGIGAVLDIGANVGSFSLMSRILFPIARIYAIEPCRESYDYLANHVGLWSVRCHNFALGNGENLHFHGTEKSGFNKFFTTQELEANKLEPTYTIPSYPLSTMFANLKVDDGGVNKKRPYIIKMDCEGGERFLLDDPGAMTCIRNSVAFLLELHLKMAGRCEVWTDYLKQFEDTHDVLLMRWYRDEIRRYYVYDHMDQVPDTSSRHQIQLIRKDWREIENRTWWV